MKQGKMSEWMGSKKIKENFSDVRIYFYADKIYANAAMETIHNEWLINQFMIFVIFPLTSTIFLVYGAIL